MGFQPNIPKLLPQTKCHFITMSARQTAPVGYPLSLWEGEGEWVFSQTYLNCCRKQNVTL